MKAAQINNYGGPDLIVVSGNAPRPTPAETQLLVEVRASSLNPIDTIIRMGGMQQKHPLQFPATLGGDFAGVIVEFGPQVRGVAAGDEVYGQASGLMNGSGTLAEYTVVDRDKTALKPKTIDFIAAASLFPDSNLLIHNIGLNPTRTAILDVFASMGGSLQMVSVRSAHGEIVGDLAVKGASLKGGVIEGDQIPLLIDELPMLAALAPYTEQGIEIRDAAELRVKESDRIAALAENLRRMGATVEERPDGLRVEGRSAGKLRGAEIEPYGDHRIAMAFAVAALAANGPTQIRDAACAAVSYPSFFEDLERVSES